MNPADIGQPHILWATLSRTDSICNSLSTSALTVDCLIDDTAAWKTVGSASAYDL